jgi:hypothetical protein
MAGENPATFAAGNAAAITKNDTTNIAPTRAIYIGGQGDLAVRMIAGNNVTFFACPAGLLLPVQVDRVLATGTTATNITAVW